VQSEPQNTEHARINAARLITATVSLKVMLFSLMSTVEPVAIQ
jgi:hypothetical protein